MQPTTTSSGSSMRTTLPSKTSRGQSLLEKLASGTLDNYITEHLDSQKHQREDASCKVEAFQKTDDGWLNSKPQEDLSETPDWLLELKPIKEPMEIDKEQLKNIEERLAKLSETRSSSEEATCFMPALQQDKTPDPITPIPPVFVQPKDEEKNSEATPAIQSRETHFIIDKNEYPVDAINRGIAENGRRHGKYPICIKISSKFIMPLSEDMQKAYGISFYGRYAQVTSSGEIASIPVIIEERLALAPNRIIFIN